LKLNVFEFKNFKPKEQQFFDHDGNPVTVDKILSVSLGHSHVVVVTQTKKVNTDPKQFAILTMGDNEFKQLGHKKTKEKWTTQFRPLYFKNQQVGDQDISTHCQIAACGPEYTLVAYSTRVHSF
jgi:alpha-tubulin suppressor-like RCC1 family protein